MVGGGARVGCRFGCQSGRRVTAGASLSAIARTEARDRAGSTSRVNGTIL